MEKVFDLSKFIALILKWKIHFSIVFLASVLISAVASSSLFIKPKFKSTEVIYPTNAKPYGTETPVEQMLQMLEANDIRTAIISKYHLLSHYGIDSLEDPYFLTNVNLEYAENITFNKTKYESVEIEVLDYSPDTALLMAKDIIALYNLKMHNIQKGSMVEVERTLNAQMLSKKQEVDKLDSVVKNMRIQYGILDYGSQVKYLSKNGKIDDQSSSVAQNLKQYGGKYISLQNELDQARSLYNGIKYEHENVVKELNRKLDYTLMVVSPEKSDKKAYPIRWLIVLISVISSMVLALVVVSVHEQNLASK